ncbi:hypothetical protein GGS21DRAFT_443508 [Xylaria nigripes]|nr:hypothetical protein GGS21DRAFT_443508 [Xylaria nigripes]
MYSMRGRSFFIHPYAQTRGRSSISAEEQRRENAIDEVTSRVNNSRTAARRTPSDPATKGKMADMKLSLAANQLSEQVKESAAFWRDFQSEYSAEVNNINLYVGGDILQKIWRKKVEYNRSRKGGDKEDDQQFDTQSMKLESCLNQVDEAAQLLAEAWAFDYNSDYDSRQYYLEKLRMTGNTAIILSKKSTENEAACRDLLDELAELEKLLDPRSSTNMLHRFNKRQAQDATRSGEQRQDGHSSDRFENADENQDAEYNSNDFEANNEQDNSYGRSGNNY